MPKSAYKQTFKPQHMECKGCGSKLEVMPQLAIYVCFNCDAEPINKIKKEKQKDYKKAYEVRKKMLAKGKLEAAES